MKRARRKPGPKSHKENARLPPRASVEVRIQHKCNLNRNNKTLYIDRYGIGLAWKVAKKTMTRLGIPPMGTYDPTNVHAGKIWGWKKEAEVLTDKKVKAIMFECIDSGKLTIDQLKAVRKSFSYAYQLIHGTDANGGHNTCNFHQQV